MLKLQKAPFVPRENVILRGVACTVPSFQAEGLTSNLSHATSRKRYTHRKALIKNVVLTF